MSWVRLLIYSRLARLHEAEEQERCIASVRTAVLGKSQDYRKMLNALKEQKLDALGRLKPKPRAKSGPAQQVRSAALRSWLADPLLAGQIEFVSVLPSRQKASTE